MFKNPMQGCDVIYTRNHNLFWSSDPSFMTNTEEFGLAMINTVLFESTKKFFENKDIRELAKNI